MEKINVLNKVITTLQTNDQCYDWSELSSCSLGLVAQVVLEKSEHDLDCIVDNLLDKIPEDKDNSWTSVLNYFCPITGLSSNKIIRTLQNSGFSREEMIHLEYLSDPQILERANIVTNELREERYGFLNLKKKTITVKIEDYHEKPENLLKYLKAWTELLVEKRDNGHSAVIS